MTSPARAGRTLLAANPTHVARNAFLDVDPDRAVGRVPHEGRDILEERFGDRRHAGDQPHVALDAAREGRGVRRKPLERERQRTRMFEHRLTGGCRHHTAPPAHQQRRAERVLELRNPLADRRRLDVFLRCGLLDVAVVADRDQQAQRLHIKVLHRGRLREIPFRNFSASDIPLVV